MKKLLTTLAALVLFAGAAFAQPGSTNPVIPGGGGGTGTIGGSTGATDNLICRADGVGGSTIQNSPLSLSDVSGVTTTLATITPAATTGATVAGQSPAVTASPAVASTDTAGAAAGGSITITAGAAARNASGNANGGNITLATGAGIGTGTAGQVVVPTGGTAAAPALSFNGDSNTGLYNDSADTISGTFGGARKFSWNANGLGIADNTYYALYGGGGRLQGVTRNVIASTQGVGSPRVPGTTGDPYSLYTNEGVSAMGYISLPTAVANNQYSFCVQDADGMRVTASTGDTIRRGASVSTAGGYIESTTIGACLTLTAINATEWFVTDSNDIAVDSWSFN